MELIQPLTRLETIELIRRLDEVDLTYLFKHTLVQETVYSSLLRNERRRLHRMIGETLEYAYPDALQENAARLAQHFAEAGDDAKTLEYGMRAGDVDAQRFAKVEAIKYYSVALDAALRLNAARETMIALITKLGRMYELQNEYTNAVNTYNRLLDLAAQRRDSALELAGLMLEATPRATPTAVFDPVIGRSLLDRALALARELNDGAAEAKIWWNFLLLDAFSGQYEKAVASGEQSLALARRLNLKTQIAYTLNDIGNYGYFTNGQPQKGRLALQEARALWRELDIPPMLADNLNNSSILDYLIGNYAEAREFSDEALEVSERISSDWGILLAHTFRGSLALEGGDYGVALYELQIADEIGAHLALGIRFLPAMIYSLLLASVGDIDAGNRVIQVARGEIGISLYRAPPKAALAYLTFLRGDLDRALEFLQEAHAGSGGELEFSYLPSIIAKGEIGLATGQSEQVIAYTETIITNLLTRDLKSFVPDAELYRGRALMTLERFADAHAAFARGYALAQELGSRRALWQICAHWSALERAQGNLERAAALRAEAVSLVESIAATLTGAYRAGFLAVTQNILPT